jgi:large conductance mechanosensitive channel
MFAEFRQFLLRGNVVDLAVAVIIGAAFGVIVKEIVEGLITPLIAAIGGQPDFSAIAFTINNSKFAIGRVINAVISFVIIGAVIFFFIIKPMNMVMARMKKEEAAAPPPAPSREEVLLTEIRDLLKEHNSLPTGTGVR